MKSMMAMRLTGLYVAVALSLAMLGGSLGCCRHSAGTSDQ